MAFQPAQECVDALPAVAPRHFAHRGQPHPHYLVQVHAQVFLEQRGNVPLGVHMAHTGDAVAQRLLRLGQKERPAGGGLQPDTVAECDLVDGAIGEPS